MTSRSPLKHACSDYVAGRFVAVEGGAITSRNPSRPDEVVWSGTPVAGHVDAAVIAARDALPEWSRRSVEERIEFLRGWQRITTERAVTIGGLISDEMGKVLSEGVQEAKALGEKVNITLDEANLGRVKGYAVPISEGKSGHCRFKPHGVMAVIGPFNFPAHLPNGHIVPALLMGNTVVFKPSEKTPAVGQLMAELMDEIGLPPGVLNVVHGGGDTASALCGHEEIDGILFTGSWPVGRRILEANVDRPGRMIALEMGGNNAAVVLDDAPLRQAVIECVRSAFATTGQRCTCTRRIIVQRKIAKRFISGFCKVASTLLVGPARLQTPVFMGPVVTEAAAKQAIAFQNDLVDRGGKTLVEATRPDVEGHFVTPGVVEVTGFSLDFDCECFGPIAQITVVDDVEEAIAQANATRYGLAASVFTGKREVFEQCFEALRAGCINWNTGTAGASGKLPFGGTGWSGNHRPAGAFSCDYCAYPVANMVDLSGEAALPAGMAIDEKWIS